MEWIIALLLLIAALALFPAALRATKRSARGKGGIGAVAMGLGLAFSAIFDPPAKTSAEEIEKTKGSRRQEYADGAE